MSQRSVGELDIIPGLLGLAGYPVSLSGIRNVLGELGLHVVDGKDIRVLKCSNRLADWVFESELMRSSNSVRDLLDAELARREGK